VIVGDRAPVREDEPRQDEHEHRECRGAEPRKRGEWHEPVDVLRREHLVERDEPSDRGRDADDKRPAAHVGDRRRGDRGEHEQRADDRERVRSAADDVQRAGRLVRRRRVPRKQQDR
jgi:hypothetical protein